MNKIIHLTEFQRAFRCGLLLMGSLLLFFACPTTAGRAEGDARLRIIVIKTRDIPFYLSAYQGFVNGLKQRGYRNGDKLEIKVVAMNGNVNADTELVKAQIGKHPTLIVTLGTDATRLVAEQKPDIPVLFSMVLDPISLGVVNSLEVPGGHFTGTTLLVSPGKQLDTLLQANPKVRRVGVLYTEDDPTSLAFLKEAKQDAQRLSLEIVAVAVRPDQASKRRLEQFKGTVDALWLIPDPASTGVQEMQDTLDFARTNHLPVLGASSATVRAGALTSLSANLEDLGDITAEMAVALLNGSETPARMRVHGPRRTLLTVNLDSARALNFKFPDALLSLADEVVDSQKESNE